MVVHDELWSMDTEWGFRDGRIGHESAWEPVVLCLVGAHSGRRLHFWGRDPSLQAFFREHTHDGFVSHYAVAEMKYLARLGIPIPERWFDTFVAWRFLSNRPNHLEAGLSSALRGSGLSHLVPADKESLRQKCLHLDFDPSNPAERQEIIDYCFSDCVACLGLYQRVHDQLRPAVMTHWVEYLKAVARMELRGIPIDVTRYAQIQQMRPEIMAALAGSVNATWPVFDGTIFKKGAFRHWCRSVNIKWPTKVSPSTSKPYHPIDKDTLKEMECRHPFVAEVREARKTLDQLEGRTLTIDPELRRHFFSTSVFRSVTGRNQPRDFIFSGPKWLRFLMIPESPDHVLVYVDYVAQEIGVAAALSGDPVMRTIYASDDCHMSFAVRAGGVPRGASEKTLRHIRKQYKTVNLGMQYGQTSFGIAHRLGIPNDQAEKMVAAHKALFPDFWRWSERTVQGAYDRGWITTPCGWRSRVPFKSNERTWMNWPMQATGSDIMRLTVTYLDRQNVRILAPVHDGFLLSCRRDQLDDLRAAVDFACRTAVEHVLPGFPLRWDTTIYEHGHFEDDDGRPLWNWLRSFLESQYATYSRAQSIG